MIPSLVLAACVLGTFVPLVQAGKVTCYAGNTTSSHCNYCGYYSDANKAVLHKCLQEQSLQYVENGAKQFYTKVKCTVLESGTQLFICSTDYCNDKCDVDYNSASILTFTSVLALLLSALIL